MILKIYFFFMLAALSGCSSDSAINTNEPVSIQVILKSDAQLNQDNTGVSNPVQVMLYQLNQEDAFKTADYFTLQQQSDSDLVSDVKRLGSYIVVPAQEKTVYLSLEKNARKIGVVTSYQNINDAHWRTIFDVPEKPERHWYNVLWSENKKWQPVVILHLKNLDTSLE